MFINSVIINTFDKIISSIFLQLFVNNGAAGGSTQVSVFAINRDEEIQGGTIGGPIQPT